MCDIFPGQLIVCFPRVDPAARELIRQIQEKEIGHVGYVESIDQRLARLDLPIDPTFELELHLLEVPPGQENWKMNYLQFFYKHALARNARKLVTDKAFAEAFDRSELHFTVVPNHVLSLLHTGTSPRPVSAKNFTFGPYYNQYKQTVGLGAALTSTTETVRVLILDSGIAPDTGFRIRSQRNFVDPNNASNVADDLGHGTAVSMLVHDLAPFVEFVIFKVADSTGRVSEWDALAGMVAKSDVHAVNLSLQFGLGDRKCNTCGRESMASRSAVFENVIHQVLQRTNKPLIVAAAGNSGKSQLAFPARFSQVLAISGITSKKELSSDSNYGDQDEAGAKHDNHFVMPGGETLASQPESVLTDSFGGSYQGTSFAAAFATGVVANRLIMQSLRLYQQGQFVTSLRQNASRSLPRYEQEMEKYGHGVMQA
jgi:subtilisin family serine protease